MKRLNVKGLNRMARAVQRGEEFVPGCTGKMQYHSQVAATERIAVRRASGARERMTTYKCKNCKQWHITSHPVRAKGHRRKVK